MRTIIPELYDGKKRSKDTTRVTYKDLGLLTKAKQMCILTSSDQREMADNWFDLAKRAADAFWVFNALSNMQKDLWFNWQSYLKDDSEINI